MGKIPTKYIAKMYESVVENGNLYIEIRGKSDYYGGTRIIWEFEYNNNSDRFVLYHYGTPILSIGLDGNYNIGAHAWSVTDQFAIKSMLYMFECYADIPKIRRKNDTIYIEEI